MISLKFAISLQKHAKTLTKILGLDSTFLTDGQYKKYIWSDKGYFADAADMSAEISFAVYV